MKEILRFENVSKVYSGAGGEERYALRDVTCRLEAGRTVAITGRSGSGKSTFLHLAAGIDLPSQGAIWFRGEELGAMPERERTLQRRDGIGLIFQFFHLLPHLAVQDNVLLPAWIAGDRLEDRAMELLDRVGLADRAADAVQKLSGGEMQRVAICRALLRRPALLLADEPTGNLDDENGARVMELLLRLREEEGTALVYVTHDPEQAALADERWRIHSGDLESA